VAAEKPGGKPTTKLARAPRLNFKLELNCGCKPPICPHAGPGIAKLLSAAYAKGRADGTRAAEAPSEPATIRVKQKGSTRAQ
jgi:hypothetical protein